MYGIRLNGSVLKVLDENKNVVWSKTITGATDNGKLTYNLPEGTVGKYIKIGLEGNNKNAFGDYVVTVAEVKVYSGVVPDNNSSSNGSSNNNNNNNNNNNDNNSSNVGNVVDIPVGTYISNRGQATQSTTFPGYPASKGVDGNRNSFSHTDLYSPGNYWELLLNNNYSIGKIEIFNRNMYGIRLNGSVLKVLDENKNVVWSKTITGATDNGKLTYNLPEGTVGKYIKIGLEGNNKNAFGDYVVTVAEVKVYSGVVPNSNSNSNNNNNNSNGNSNNVDNTPPNITLNGGNPIELAKGTAYIESGATAIDDIDGAVNVTVTGNVDVNRVGTYTITYKAKDSAGNEATLTRTVKVKRVGITIQNSTNKPNLNSNIASQLVDSKVEEKFGKDTTSPITMNSTQQLFIGNWYGSENYVQVRLQLKADGTYNYFEYIGIGNKHNVGRSLTHNGHWSLQNGNSQIVLSSDDSEVPIIISARYPNLVASSGVTLWGGSNINREATVQTDTSQDIVINTLHEQKVKNIFSKNLRGKLPNYFTMVATKFNKPDNWNVAGIEPPGFNYGHKIYKPTVQSDIDAWQYAVSSNKNRPQDYAIVISDESWTVFMGSRKSFEASIQDPHRLYRWFLYWKTEMQMLGKLNNGVIHIFAGDAPAHFMGVINSKYDNNASKIPANIAQTLFPEALELNPPQTFAGIFQVMDYIRMKYAPNVRMGYTIKEWGSQGIKDREPTGGWENDPTLNRMADEINSFGVSFDYLAFNFNPTVGNRSDNIYKARAKYFGAISKKLLKRDGKTLNNAKVWIWKTSLWSNHPSFYFRNIDFLVNQANVAGMTLGHGNDWKGHKLGDYQAPATKWPLESWIEEYYRGESKNISPQGTIGKVYLP